MENNFCEYCESPLDIYGDKDSDGEPYHMCEGVMIDRLRMAVLLLLDHVDFTNRACGITDMVGAVLPVPIIEKVRGILEESDGHL